MRSTAASLSAGSWPTTRSVPPPRRTLEAKRATAGHCDWSPISLRSWSARMASQLPPPRKVGSAQSPTSTSTRVPPILAQLTGRSKRPCLMADRSSTAVCSEATTAVISAQVALANQDRELRPLPTSSTLCQFIGRPTSCELSQLNTAVRGGRCGGCETVRCKILGIGNRAASLCAPCCSPENDILKGSADIRLTTVSAKSDNPPPAPANIHADFLTGALANGSVVRQAGK
mmetsp:Transcript_106877/g.212228  ORF Transcript_106877/g.212228 Transcript_106877/m.212228 type:complete len:231 (-) Transcript_106877:128-820(-)